MFPYPGMLQRLFDVLMYLFNQVGFHTNVRKTAGMTLRTCHDTGRLFNVGYGKWVTGIGKSYQERL